MGNKGDNDMKKGLLLAAVAALMITPAAAFAKGGPGKGGPGSGKGAPNVMYVLRGTLSAYRPYNNSIYGSQNGSITITVKGGNHHAKALNGQALTFPVDANTKIVLVNGVAAIADGDRGLVKIKAPRRIAPVDLASTLQGLAAFQVIDKGASH
jgi:hypothetical protein